MTADHSTFILITSPLLLTLRLSPCNGKQSQSTSTNMSPKFFTITLAFSVDHRWCGITTILTQCSLLFLHSSFKEYKLDLHLEKHNWVPSTKSIFVLINCYLAISSSIVRISLQIPTGLKMYPPLKQALSYFFHSRLSPFPTI